MYSALAHISGGHFNPAITIGFWVTKRSTTVEVALYWFAQILGAIVAALLLKAIIPEDAWRAATLGTPELVRDFPRLSAEGSKKPSRPSSSSWSSSPPRWTRTPSPAPWPASP